MSRLQLPYLIIATKMNINPKEHVNLVHCHLRHDFSFRLLFAIMILKSLLTIFLWNKIDDIFEITLLNLDLSISTLSAGRVT